MKKYLRMSSAAVVIGTLRVKWSKTLNIDASFETPINSAEKAL